MTHFSPRSTTTMKKRKSLFPSDSFGSVRAGMAVYKMKSMKKAWRKALEWIGAKKKEEERHTRTHTKKGYSSKLAKFNFL